MAQPSLSMITLAICPWSSTCVQLGGEIGILENSYVDAEPVCPFLRIASGDGHQLDPLLTEPVERSVQFPNQSVSRFVREPDEAQDDRDPTNEVLVGMRCDRLLVRPEKVT